MSNFERDLLYEQLGNFQIQRHDFLNSFQVIRGYLQLNMPEKALEYIDEALVGLLPQQEIYKIGQKSLLSILLGLFFGLRLKGVEMTINFPPELKSEGYWQERWQKEYAQQFYGYTKECLRTIPHEKDPDDLLAEIVLNPAQKGFTCKFVLLDNGEQYLQREFSTGT